MPPIGLLHGTQSQPGTFAGNYYWFTVMHPEYAPNTLIDPSTRERIRLIPAGAPSKALRNLLGGVETNNRPGGVHQVEIVGMSEDFWSYSEQWYANCAQMLQEEADYAGFPCVFHADPTRFTFEQWYDPSLKGWYGHCNVPENDHWDPGTINFSKLERLMALDLTQIIYAHPDGDRSRPLQGYPLGDYLTYVLDCANNAERSSAGALAALPGIANGISAVLTLLQNGAAAGGGQAYVDVPAIAKAVADELWRRLEK